MKLKKVFSCLCSVLLFSALSLQTFAKTNEQPLTLSPVSLEEYPLYQKEDRSASAYIVMEGHHRSGIVREKYPRAPCHGKHHQNYRCTDGFGAGKS